LQEAIGDRGGRVIFVDFREHKEARSIPHVLARTAGVPGASIRSVEALTASPELSGAVFMIDGIAPGEFTRLGLFLRSYANAFTRIGSMLAPMILSLLPGDLPRSETTAVFGRDLLTWRSVVSRLDIRNYVAQSLPHLGDNFLELTAVETLVSIAGWDAAVVDHLAQVQVESLVDPRPILEQFRTQATGVVPSWSAGLVDEIDGAPFVHSLSCVAHDPHALHVRVWAAHARTTLPFIEQAKRHFIAKYKATLAQNLPYRVETRGGVKLIETIERLEINHIRYLLSDHFMPAELSFAKALLAARNKVAHGDIIDPSLIALLSEAWIGLLDQRPSTSTVGWNWPRCGQRLVIMIGPSCAGKTTLAKRRYDSDAIISTDDIRMELYGSLTSLSDQDEVFKLARERAAVRLSRGESAIIDATNLRQRDRLAFVDLVPADMAVAYEIVDRPLADKLETAGWRAERKHGDKSLIEGHHALFEAELQTILSGDGRPNVTVLDLRNAVEKDPLGEIRKSA
jgi:predicted kinase